MKSFGFTTKWIKIDNKNETGVILRILWNIISNFNDQTNFLNKLINWQVANLCKDSSEDFLLKTLDFLQQSHDDRAIGSGTIILIISNEEIEDMKIVKSLEDSGLLVKSVIKTIESEK